MDNLISSEMVINVLENIDCSDGVGLSALKCDVVNDAIIAIKALPFIQLEKIIGRWQEITKSDCGEKKIIDNVTALTMGQK